MRNSGELDFGEGESNGLETVETSVSSFNPKTGKALCVVQGVRGKGSVPRKRMREGGKVKTDKTRHLR